MEGTPEQHQHVHTEVVDVEEPGLGKKENKDTKELGDRDPTKHRGSHVFQSRSSPFPTSSRVGYKPTNYVRAELNCYSNRLCVCARACVCVCECV